MCKIVNFYNYNHFDNLNLFEDLGVCLLLYKLFSCLNIFKWQYDEEKWDEDFESDLCILWDMTATPAVVHFLMKHGCLNLIVTTLQSTSNPRLLVSIYTFILSCLRFGQMPLEPGWTQPLLLLTLWGLYCVCNTCKYFDCLLSG